MATLPSGDHNLESLNENSKINKKYSRTRSRAYRRRRAAKRRKLSVHKRKVLQRYLKNKVKRVQMFEPIKHISELPSLVPQNSTSCQGDEAAFWKSKAISLQYENRMLQKHIEEMYTQIIQSRLSIEPNNHLEQQEEPCKETNNKYLETQTCDEELYAEQNHNECLEEEEEEGEEEENENNINISFNKKAEQKKTKDETLIDPPTQDKKIRLNEMKTLYGESYRKIMGMETVIQMHYDVALDKEKINYWPVLPIRFV